MQNLCFQIMLIFILIIFFIYKILVRTSKKVKKFDAKYHFINFAFVGLIGAAISLNIGNALISILATIMMRIQTLLLINSKQFSSGEFFKWGIPASIVLLIILGLVVTILWLLMGMPIPLAN